MVDIAPKPEVTVIDDPKAPETFAAEVLGFFIHAGNIHITFATPRVNHEKSPGPINRVVIHRLVMPVPGAQGLAAGLYDFLKSHGYDPVPVPPKDQMQ